MSSNSIGHVILIAIRVPRATVTAADGPFGLPAIDQTWQPRSVCTIAIRSDGDAAKATPPRDRDERKCSDQDSATRFIASVSGLRRDS